MTAAAARDSRHASTLPNGRNLFLNKFELTPTGLVPNGDPSFAEWEALGCFLQVVEGAIQWWIGDWLKYGEERFHERAAQAVDATGLEPATVMQYEWVARNVPIERRLPELSFSHHREVADLPAQEQTQWLHRAKEGTDGSRWSVDKLRLEIKAARTDAPRVYWLMVACNGKDDLDALIDRLQREGRTCKTAENR